MIAPAQNFRLVGGIDYSEQRDDKMSVAEARRIARPILRDWLKRVECNVVDGKLSALDLMMARELTNYPSANQGRCYAGQERLGKAIGKCARTARTSLHRLCSAGLLTGKRGGPGRTASWTFCINGQPVFAAAGCERQTSAQDRKGVAGLDRKEVAGLDRQDVADKPIEQNPSELQPIERNPSPQPPVASEAAPKRDFRSVELSEPRTGEPTFETFWHSLQGNPGSSGAALAAWRKLSAEDRQAIDNLIGPHGIDLEGVWACTWLNARRWESGSLRRRRVEAAERPRFSILKPDSPEWRAERQRLVEAGEAVAVSMMDEFCAQNRSWTVRSGITAAIDGYIEQLDREAQHEVAP